MRYGLMAAILLVLAAGSYTEAQEYEISPSRLQKMGLGRLQAVPPQPTAHIQPRQVPRVYVGHHPGVIHGRRQLHIGTHTYQRDNLKRQAWRIAHRMSRF